MFSLSGHFQCNLKPCKSQMNESLLDKKKNVYKIYIIIDQFLLTPQRATSSFCGPIFKKCEKVSSPWLESVLLYKHQHLYH